MTITIEDQIKCVEREISMRRRVYPRWVANNRMKQESADREIATMEAVLETLMDAAAPPAFLSEALNAGDGAYRP